MYIGVSFRHNAVEHLQATYRLNSFHMHLEINKFLWLALLQYLIYCNCLKESAVSEVYLFYYSPSRTQHPEGDRNGLDIVMGIL